MGSHVYEGRCVFVAEREVGGCSCDVVVCRPLSRAVCCMCTLVPALVTADVGYYGTSVGEVSFNPHVDVRRVFYDPLGSL